jgi:hypothetical protein
MNIYSENEVVQQFLNKLQLKPVKHNIRRMGLGPRAELPRSTLANFCVTETEGDVVSVWSEGKQMLRDYKKKV